MKKIKLAESEDFLISENIQSMISILNNLNITYSVIGSCAIQSYFNSCFKLPNDLDIVVKEPDMVFLKNYAILNGLYFKEDIGRAKMIYNNLQIHIIPGSLHAINKFENNTYGQIDLSCYLEKISLQSLNLIFAKVKPVFPVFPIEINLFLELVRPAYTGSMISIFFILLLLDIDLQKFKNIYQENQHFSDIIQQRIDEHREAMHSISFFNQKDIEFVKSKLNNLSQFIIMSNSNFNV